MSISKLVIVLQVRLNSSRLYGKALMKINKIPILILAAKRLSNKGHKVIVATSNNKIDDPIISCLKKYNLDYYRGDSKNVLKRIVDALEDFKDNTTVVRATADNIFPDGNLVDEMYSYYVSKKLSYLGSNGVDSGLPYGVSLELIKLRELKVANRIVKKITDREHVTLFTKRNKDHIFKIDSPSEIIFCGGGVHNQFLMDRIKNKLSEITISTTDKYGISPDALEAISFAILANETIHGNFSNLPSVTGAKRKVILGKIVR